VKVPENERAYRQCHQVGFIAVRRDAKELRTGVWRMEEPGHIAAEVTEAIEHFRERRLLLPEIIVIERGESQ
jgi:hypothetical protein